MLVTLIAVEMFAVWRKYGKYSASTLPFWSSCTFNTQHWIMNLSLSQLSPRTFFPPHKESSDTNTYYYIGSF